MAVKFTNNASTTVSTGINTSATSLTVASASAFPQLAGAGDYCYLTIQQATGTDREVVKATALSTNTFTITRAQDGTSAGTWSAGDIVELRVAAALLEDLISSSGTAVTNTFTTDSFTANGSTTAYALSQTTSSENNLLVFIEGVFQQQDAYSIATSSGTTTLTFSSAPANGNSILIYSVAAAVSGSNLNRDQFTGNGSTTAFTLSISPVTEDNTQVFLEGVYQSKSNYSVSGTTLTMATAPSSGAILEVMTFTQTAINVPIDNTITSAKLSGDLTTPGDLAVTGALTLGSTEITATGTELNYVDGVTSAIQTQLSAKAPLARPVFSNTTADSAAAVFTSTSQASKEYGVRITLTNDPNNGSNYILEGAGGTTNRVQILSNGNVVNQNNAYGGMSDERLKENIVEAQSQWTDVLNFRFVNYSLISEKSEKPTHLGLCAGDLQRDGMGKLVEEVKNFTENSQGIREWDGTTTRWVNYSVAAMKATIALQESMRRIEALEAKVNALESK